MRELQNIDIRLRKVEDCADQILSTLAVIHRFMSAHTSIQDNMQGSSSNLSSEFRLRAASESEKPSALPVSEMIKHIIFIPQNSNPLS